MIYIIGGNGFVGSAYVRLARAGGLPHQVISRENYQDFFGTSCDLLVNANGNSRKYVSAREPLADFDASVRSVAESLETFKAGTYVLLSSGDVYPDQSASVTTREADPIGVRRVSLYGLHKYLAEQLVMNRHPNWLIMRMGGFVGPGLKKNAVFDMLTGAPVWLDPGSELQFIGTDAAAQLVIGLAFKGVRREIVNLGATGLVNIGALHRRIGSKSVFQPSAPIVRFELSLDKLAALTGETLPNAATEVETFVAGELSRRKMLPDAGTVRV